MTKNQPQVVFSCESIWYTRKGDRVYCDQDIPLPGYTCTDYIQKILPTTTVHSWKVKEWVNEVNMSKTVGQKVKFEINLENSHAPQEIKAVNGANIEIRYDSGKIYDPKTEEICPRCEGGGMYMECYGGPPCEVTCDTCDGRGIVEKEILEPHYPEEFKNSLIKDPFKVRDLHGRSLDCAAELFEVEYQGEGRVGFQNKIISAIEYYAAGQIRESSNQHVDVYYRADADLDKFAMDHWGIARMQTMNEDDTIRLETDAEFRDRIVRTITGNVQNTHEKYSPALKSGQKSKIKGISPNEVINLSQGSKNDD